MGYRCKGFSNGNRNGKQKNENATDKVKSQRRKCCWSMGSKPQVIAEDQKNLRKSTDLEICKSKVSFENADKDEKKQPSQIVHISITS